MDPMSQSFLQSSFGQMLIKQHSDYLSKAQSESIEKEVKCFVDEKDQRAMRFSLTQQAGVEEIQSWLGHLPQDSMTGNSWDVIQQISEKLEALVVSAKTNADNYRMASVSPLKWELIRGLEENRQEFAAMSFDDMKEKELSFIKREQGVRTLQEGVNKLRGGVSGGGRGHNRGRGSGGSGRGNRSNYGKGGQVRGPVPSSYSSQGVADSNTRVGGPVKSCYTCGGPHYAKQCGKVMGPDKKRKAN